MSVNPQTQVEPKSAVEPRGAIRAFLADYWLWILIPFAVVFLGLLAVYLLAGGGDGASPFQYNVF